MSHLLKRTHKEVSEFFSGHAIGALHRDTSPTETMESDGPYRPVTAFVGGGSGVGGLKMAAAGKGSPPHYEKVDASPENSEKRDVSSASYGSSSPDAVVDVATGRFLIDPLCQCLIILKKITSFRWWWLLTRK